MIPTKIIFRVTTSTAKSCYVAGDTIIVSDLMLIPPAGKGLCKHLIPRLVDIIEKEELQNPSNHGQLKFSCKGDNRSCLGVLNLEVMEINLSDKGASSKSKQIIELIRKVAFFRELTSAELLQIVPLLSYKKLAPDTVIFKKDEHPKNVYIIISGGVQVADGDNLVASLGAGEIFGEMSHLTKKKASATVTATQVSWIIEISNENFQLILDNFATIQLFLVRLLSKRLAQATVDRTEEFEAGMAGKLAYMPPIDLFQMFNTSQKTGSLRLDLPRGEAALKFQEGELVRVSYDNRHGKEAFYEILKETDGSFLFAPEELTDQLIEEPVGSFMGLLLEGLRQLDEGL